MNTTDTKQTRQKSYNYTQRHDALQKNVEMVKQGKASYKDPESLLIASGYTKKGANNIAKGHTEHKGTIELLKELWPMDEVINDTKRIQTASEASEQYGNALKAIDIRLKLGGEYAAVKQEIEVSGTVKHEGEVTLGKTDYAEFKKQQLQNRTVIDGEIINTLPDKE